MNERIRQIIEYYGLSVRAFEQKIFVSEGTIYRGLTRNSDFGSSILGKILNNCSDISPEWLLLGKGEMLRFNTPADAGNHHGSDPVAAILEKIIAEKDNRIEALVRDNERLRQQLDTEREKSASQSAATASV